MKYVITAVIGIAIGVFIMVLLGKSPDVVAKEKEYQRKIDSLDQVLTTFQDSTFEEISLRDNTIAFLQSQNTVLDSAYNNQKDLTRFYTRKIANTNNNRNEIFNRPTNYSGDDPFGYHKRLVAWARHDPRTPI